jgi:hypothetical protein
MGNKTREQHSKVFNRTNELIDKNIKNVFSRKKGNLTFKDCLEIARKELLVDEPAINDYSLSSVYDIGYRRHEEKRHFDKPKVLSLQSKKFPSAKKFVKDINVEHWFGTAIKNVYNVKSDDLYI